MIRPRPEPPVMDDDFSYCSSWFLFSSNDNAPPVTTATKPSTSYKSCLLYLEVIANLFERKLQLGCLSRTEEGRGEKSQVVNDFQNQMYVLRMRCSTF